MNLKNAKTRPQTIVALFLAAALSTASLASCGASDSSELAPQEEGSPASSLPALTPSAQATSPAPVNRPGTTGPVAQSQASDFDISEAEYTALVDSYKIDVATHATAESAVIAFNEKMTNFFTAGNTAEDREKHAEWLHPSDSTMNPGWNNWATQLNLRAIQDGLFVANYKNTVNSYLPSMEESKRNAGGLWVNSLKANETAYKVNYEFTPTGFAKLSNGNFTAYGSVTFTDNAREIPSASNDSRAAFEKTFEDQSVTAVIQGGEWRIHELAVK